jgi:hypothetical protein
LTPVASLPRLPNSPIPKIGHLYEQAKAYST